jgi:hypothetical protein
VHEHQNLPDINRFSVVMAMILIAYSLTAVISFPAKSLTLQLPGFLFELNLNFVTLVSILVAALATAGCDWIISDHPIFEEKTRWRHWFIPALTAMVIGVPLNILEVSPAWWGVFALGGLLLSMVMVSEYISVDPGDNRSPLAIISLTAVSLALFLTLTIALRGSGSRLYLVLAALAPAGFMVSARSLMLRTSTGLISPWAIGISIVLTGISAGIYYLPLKPIQFGLILTGLLFALIILAGNIEDHRQNQGIWLEPALLTCLFCLIAVFL